MRKGAWWPLLGCLLILSFAAWLTPRLADGVAYLAGAGGGDVFVAQANGQHCDKSGCHPYTTGVLQHRGVSVTWPGTVSPGSRFPVRVPIWPSGEGRTIISGTGDALTAIGMPLVAYLLGAGLLVSTVRRARASWGGRPAGR
jgi:hypothetical protein